MTTSRGGYDTKRYHTVLTLTAHSYHPSPADSQSLLLFSHSLSLSLTLFPLSLLSLPLYYYQLPHTNSLPIQFPKKYCISVLVSLLINIASLLVFFSTPPFSLFDFYNSLVLACFAIPIMTWNCLVIPVLSLMAARFTGRTSTAQNHHFLSIATNLPCE